ncbi:saccharopine dehydrogenase family protein [Oceanicola sp. S124]|uniref:saccharopine dehydrogenase family protein n=1 Tax=Oceanicola sp. S124 TaxID=1042378 RepID=UPI00025590DF|nr:saccharopine dehydrogenase family protein [Oceanicola sp. S124]
MKIHWCGTGLSAIPGLRRLLEGGYPVVVWNRTVEKAEAEVGDLTSDIRAFSLEAVTEALEPGDIAVSMLPADLHVPLASACLQANAHFVCSSYVSPEMAALDGAAKEKGLSLVNEVGLDPGIDHVFADDLVARLRALAPEAPEVSFTSYCGGFPKVANDFRYKFSWSPLGVLKALRSPSRSLKDGQELHVARPWDAITPYENPLPGGEVFEAYPNRDSVPFIAQYGFDESWQVKDFVRGTLRLGGWATAWEGLFREIETLTGPGGDARLREISDGLWDSHAYDEGEADRVVMFVRLTAEAQGKPVFDQAWAMDASDRPEGSAMGRLVSVSVALAIEALVAARLVPGVVTASNAADPLFAEDIRSEWLSEVEEMSDVLERIDFLG